jgi:hypothetical protein
MCHSETAGYLASRSFDAGLMSPDATARLFGVSPVATLSSRRLLRGDGHVTATFEKSLPISWEFVVPTVIQPIASLSA